MKLLVIVLVFGIVSCQTQKPQSEAGSTEVAPAAKKTSYAGDLNLIHTFNRPEYRRDIGGHNCLVTMSTIHDFLRQQLKIIHQLKIEQENWAEFEDQIFTFRKQFATLSADWPSECVIKLRESIYEFVKLRDYLGEKLFLDQIEGHSAQVGQWYDVENFNFLSGDVLLVRRDSLRQAVISQMASRPQHYTQVLHVYVDPQDKKVYAMEKLRPSGWQIRPWPADLKKDSVRVLLLRSKKPDEAQAATHWMFNKIKTSKGKALHKDFFQEAYKTLYKKSLPWISTSPPRGTYDMTYLPSELETDPHFELEFEWTHYPRLADLRRKEVISRRILNQFKKHDASGTNLDKLTEFGRPYLKRLKEKDDESIKTQGRHLTEEELQKILKF